VTKRTINKRALELICHSHSHNCIKTSGAQVWRGSATAATAIGILVFGYGLDSLLGVLALERCMLPWLAIGYKGLLLELFYMPRLRCSGVGFDLWLVDNIANRL
jgi:hypothetical protein